MADWDKMAMMHCVIGFEAEILGLVTYFYKYDGWSHPVQGLLIVAFCLYFFGTAMLSSARLSGANNVNIIVSILTMICMFVTGVFLVIGVGLNVTNSVSVPYSATLLMSAAFLAFLTLIFLIVHLFTRDSRAVSNGTTRA